jgi:dCTP deaminase
MLSDNDILNGLENKDLIINPFDISQLQPASYDIKLGFEFLVFDNTKVSEIDPKKPVHDFMKKIVLSSENDFIILHPREFILGVSFERIGTNNKYSCQLMGKSSLARLGLIVHTTAGFIDPGNTLNITLEMANFNNVPLKLHPMMKIAQVGFFKLNTPSKKVYGDPTLNSKYYGSKTVQASKMDQNYNAKT